MKQPLGHCANCTLVTLRSSSRQDDQNLNLENSYVGHAETALLSSTCTVTAQSFQQGLKVKLPQCGSNFVTSWLPCEVKSFVLNDAQTRRPMAQISAAHAASTYLRSSRSSHLSLTSTAQSFEQV
eukprot:symbB.v1.2.037902.t1/scaffold5731.1/size24151/2